ncbi:precorrin-6y C5,15-methyltransferase (decarboxylating) subunit CbiE [Streptomyces sp. NPDC048304]|uniref:precorrin-6y C5,15-methyltransferase (decarboxylating) subunit CbiE n=1 Tax=Streptomyces sp. NPDC048304 TaxID=3154820 RepID=UPI0033CDD16B
MITVVGTGTGAPVPEDLLAGAALVVGGRRHLEAVRLPDGAERVVLGPLAPALDTIAEYVGKELPVLVLASGDPGFFGIVRALAERFGPRRLQVRPGVSSVAAAFARVGLPWDDAVVVSAHGRDLRTAVNVCRARPKTAVLTGPGAGPAELGAALLHEAGTPGDATPERWAGSAEPGAGPTEPGRAPGPGAGPTKPGAGPAEPGAGPAEPEAGPIEPGRVPGPGAGPTKPGAGPAEPEARLAEPGRAPGPGAGPTKPGTRPTEPGRVPESGAGPAEPEAGPTGEYAAPAAPGRVLVVASALGSPYERVERVTPAEAAARDWGPDVNVVLCLDETRALGGVRTVAGVPAGPGRWALDEGEFAHRDSMITKFEVRALALARLGPRLGDLVWDVGAGSGSVAVECARLGAAVVAVEKAADGVERIRANARAHGVEVRVVHGAAPKALDGLDDPDAVFVGGGGRDLPAVVHACARRARRTVVVAMAALDRVPAAREALTAAGFACDGVLLQSSRLAPLPGDVTRLAATNPVFLLWGDRTPASSEGVAQ